MEALQVDLAAARERIAALEAMLVKHQWALGVGSQCPECWAHAEGVMYRYRPDDGGPISVRPGEGKHDEDCALAALLPKETT